jgi:hypothetical protein
VYHIVRDGVAIYVGQTVNVFSRISSWRSGKFEREDFDHVEFFPCAVEELNALEERHIRELRPRLNVEGVTEPYRAPIRVSNAPRWWHERRAAGTLRDPANGEAA